MLMGCTLVGHVCKVPKQIRHVVLIADMVLDDNLTISNLYNFHTCVGKCISL